MPERKEGAVIVALMAFSTLAMMLIVGAICIVGSRHSKLYNKQEVLAESQGVEIEAETTEHEAMMLQVLV